MAAEAAQSVSSAPPGILHSGPLRSHIRGFHSRRNSRVRGCCRIRSCCCCCCRIRSCCCHIRSCCCRIRSRCRSIRSRCCCRIRSHCRSRCFRYSRTKVKRSRYNCSYIQLLSAIDYAEESFLTKRNAAVIFETETRAFPKGKYALSLYGSSDPFSPGDQERRPGDEDGGSAKDSKGAEDI